MNKALSIAFLAVGVILLIYGFSASDSIGSSFSRFFAGSPTDKTIWLMIGGAAAVLIGLTGLFRGTRVP